MKKYKIYCGPTITRDVAHRLSLWDVHTYLIGTEHIYVESILPAHRIVDILGRSGGWSDSDVILLNN